MHGSWTKGLKDKSSDDTSLGQECRLRRKSQFLKESPTLCPWERISTGKLACSRETQMSGLQTNVWHVGKVGSQIQVSVIISPPQYRTLDLVDMDWLLLNDYD